VPQDGEGVLEPECSDWSQIQTRVLCCRYQASGHDSDGNYAPSDGYVLHHPVMPLGTGDGPSV